MSRDTHVGSPDISEARVHLMATELRLKLCSSGADAHLLPPGIQQHRQHEESLRKCAT